jgi:Methyltransferase domain
MAALNNVESAGTKLAVAEHAGPAYDLVLAAMHKHLRPKSYFEIGTLTGITLRLASCPSIAVDPMFQIAGNVLGGKQQCFFFQQPSDDFFAAHSPSQLLGRSVDLAFLDGMHYYEYLLRDFMNIERHCARNSVVVLHDCIPCNIHLARRDANDMSLKHHAPVPTQWAGDVWKTVAALKKHRPDLRIHAYDAPPTGLIVITNLDPRSEVLAENYFAIVEDFAGLDLADHGVDRLHRDFGVKPSAELMDHGSLSKLLWL